MSRPGAASTTTLVTGPVRSGKSRHAEDLLEGHEDVTYVATGRPADLSDPEWSRRVAHHRARRPGTWRTLETTDVAGAIRAATGPVLVDCLGTWLTALVDDAGWDDLVAAADAVRREADRLVESLCAARVPVVVVTNEVGWSLVATTASGRLFQDELGRLNALVAGVAAQVHLVVAGRVVDLSGAPVVPREPRPRTLDA
ncbi:bifunctional adenosylcobinamide kinase/adenosylcobinamide-phosphate guanylyltransferase [Terrabacter sp. Soil810]|uniref:bifunctional adenosylcobinamide kinase/adenosylcobinamide-phosphate guanylyltransferase n=1 Tax=Terrabacter sp. Soil810 TaxID=1736418 RepID=UPI00070FEA01|nr:bifunctional adenosylcobinamide kinase/adenosylcobinamide-phosphate guanylyltransferase [Terrabacter sp. Soil810]KRF41054.1 adenosylcobinamide kinase [Terrabacter sp. Soil810]